MGVGAQWLCDRRGSARCVLQAQHFAPRPRPERDAVDARGGLSRREHVFRINDSVRIRHIGHALFFDQVAQAGQQLQDARDDLGEQRLLLCIR